MLVNAENFNCPGCGEPLGEDNLMDLCAEPFNGICFECPTCGDNITADLVINLRKI